LLGGTNPFTGQSLHPSPVQSSRSIQCMKTVQAPIQVLIFTCFLWDQVWASQITKLRKRICWVEPTLLQVSSFTQDISCTKLNTCSTCRQSRFRNKFSFSTFFVGPDLYMHVTDQENEVQENLLRGTNPFTSRFLHPSLVQSSRSIQHIQTVQTSKKESFLVTCFFVCVYVGPILCFTNQKIQKENLLGRTNPNLGQFFQFTRISCSKGPLGTCKTSKFLNKFLR